MNTLDTSQQIRHVYGCQGTPIHVTPGFELLRQGNITKCPQCGQPVTDISNTPLGQAYFAFARPDLYLEKRVQTTQSSEVTT